MVMVCCSLACGRQSDWLQHSGILNAPHPTRAICAGVAAPERHARAGRPQQQELLRGHTDQGRSGALDLHPGAATRFATHARLSLPKPFGASRSRMLSALHWCVHSADACVRITHALLIVQNRQRPLCYSIPPYPTLICLWRLAGARGRRVQGRGGGGV